MNKLIPSLKKHLHGPLFNSSSDTITIVTVFLEDFKKLFETNSLQYKMRKVWCFCVYLSDL
jgi:hypothetical protein